MRLPALHRQLASSLLMLALAGFSLGVAAQTAADTPKPSAQFMQMLHAWLEKGEYRAQAPRESEWLDSGDRYTILEDSPGKADAVDLVAYDTQTGNRAVLVSGDKLTPSGQSVPLRIEHYQWSADHSQLLIFTNTQKVWRLHTRGDYWVLRLSDGNLTKLGGGAPPASLMFAKFSPDGHTVAYVRENNLYVEDLAASQIRQITHDGSTEIINGTTDWVTEEELDLRDAFRWSPDSASIAYWQFDQSGVGDYTLINDTDASYPTTFKYRYPHPGGTNASVRVGVVSAQGVITMRWQSTWPSKDIFHEFAQDYAKKVNDMTGGDLRIDSTNPLNHVTFPGWNTTFGSAQFGLPTTANAMRSMTIGFIMRF